MCFGTAPKNGARGQLHGTSGRRVAPFSSSELVPGLAAYV